jgi:hypothetical protein
MYALPKTNATPALLLLLLSLVSVISEVSAKGCHAGDPRITESTFS